MLGTLTEVLNSQKVVLASSSPWRCEILRRIGLKFQIVPSKFEENLDKSSFQHPKDYVLENAKQKALEVANRLRAESKEVQPDLVIGADTVVVLQYEILEKPKTKEKAFDMLKSLSGCDHKVYTGVALVQPDCTTDSSKGIAHSGLVVTQFYDETSVTFGDLTDDIIHGYINTGEPLDKAGAYGIQGIGGSLVKEIHGDFFNVVGFPLHHFCIEVKKLYSSHHI